jgi:hypothetical protein
VRRQASVWRHFVSSGSCARTAVRHTPHSGGGMDLIDLTGDDDDSAPFDPDHMLLSREVEQPHVLEQIKLDAQLAAKMQVRRRRRLTWAHEGSLPTLWKGVQCV